MIGALSSSRGRLRLKRRLTRLRKLKFDEIVAPKGGQSARRKWARVQRRIEAGVRWQGGRLREEQHSCIRPKGA